MIGIHLRTHSHLSQRRSSPPRCASHGPDGNDHWCRAEALALCLPGPNREGPVVPAVPPMCMRLQCPHAFSAAMP